MRANISYADKAVIFAQDINDNKAETGESLDEMHDAESIFIYKAIKKINPTIQIMIELVYSSNIEFLLDRDFKYQNEFKYEFVSNPEYIIDTPSSLRRGLHICHHWYPDLLVLLQSPYCDNIVTNSHWNAIIYPCHKSYLWTCRPKRQQSLSSSRAWGLPK